MNPSQAIKLAFEILEGDFVLQYFSDEHLNLMQRLEESLLSPKGEVILLQGSAGCGLTTLLRRLQAQHPTATHMLKGDIYIGYWDFVDHLCDAFNIRRGDYRKKLLPAHLLRVLSLTKRKVLMIDDLDIYISNEDELSQVFSIIRNLSAKVPGLTVVLSTRNKQLINRFFKYSQENWWSHSIQQRISLEAYYDFANRLWNGLNERYSLDVVLANPESVEPQNGLNLQDVNRALRVHYVERFLLQHGALGLLSNLNDLNE
ncbi:ATP-binding cassette domain-containing protein [Pseudomonas moraviensis]|uniref:ATP-binding cassette domain-containing protein n=1 Tax=Pseudomonas moraviensis TaxID=321662 RepID=UPI000937CD05|nr:ABC transporter ATP-binding protein [Pseudomonas moraviensis]OJT48396.1 hypothetical protein BSZ28_26335 [Pseudomonas moraviensis]